MDEGKPPVWSLDPHAPIPPEPPPPPTPREPMPSDTLPLLRNETMHCESLHCLMRAAVCIDRQEAKNRNGGGSWPRYEPCGTGKCVQGALVRLRINQGESK